MPDYKGNWTMSEGGRGNRDNHSISFRMRHTGAFNRVDAAALALGVAQVLAAVMFERTAFLRCTIGELNASGLVVVNSGITIPLAVFGANAFAAGDGPTRDNICLALEKGAQVGRNGTSLLRHCMSADEEATYLNTGAIPARFGALPVGSPMPGSALGDALLTQFIDNNFEMLLPPLRINNVLTARVVETIAAQDFRSVKPTRDKMTAEQAEAMATQRRINELREQAWRLYRWATGQGTLADVVATITQLATAALAIYNALTLPQRVLVRMPTFPALPAP